MSAPKLTGKQIAERLASVEALCNRARVKIGVGNLKAWEKNADTLAAIADLLCDAETDLRVVSDEIEARQIAAERP